ncbi:MULTISPECIES: hypothetical protein [Dehalobacter]|uniref:Uncharacterized protein n=6 Tax=Dehalobacter TaxID=56112 RepID=A0A857DF49_9FIRM|nr:MULTISPECIES: hypothetical protein [Dehalobacter]AHF11216.1 hypothetical protein DEHRE_01665 [Dehalobacter restrictus DSM 9455]MCG1026646.1 hypothetical protein [Dehalobacter sp.]MDJ0306100.1 hypothetical protein [Dehalobacter sp.]QGZ99506.1 hypothetical protein GQ588_01945 [Dehalobacter restrictus]
MEGRRLAIPIYLNQRIVFDLLAIVEGGFSQLQTIKKAESDEKGSNSEISGEVGTKNVFAFLNLGLKAGLNQKDTQSMQKHVQEDRVFTPASLFSRLRDNLIERKLLVSLDNAFSMEALLPGAFIEFSGILRKNPMVANMEGLIQMMEAALLFTVAPGKQKPKAEQEVLTQMKKFYSMLTQTGSLDLVSDLVIKPEIKAVIPVQLEYFSNQSPADIIDGQFVVIGKVVRYIPEDIGESVSLLRGTPLAYLPEDNLMQFIEAFNTLSSTLSTPSEFTTQIPGPVLLVVPIAIYA